jgi:hypothetical protein
VVAHVSDSQHWSSNDLNEANSKSELGLANRNWPISTAIGVMTLPLTSLATGGYAIAFHFRLIGNPEFHFRSNEMCIPSSMHVIGGGIVLLPGGLRSFRHQLAVLTITKTPNIR